MQTIEVKTGRPYPIQIEPGCFARLPALLTEFCGKRRRKLAILTDDRVDALPFCAGLCDRLGEAGFSVCKYVFANGERQKSLETVADFYRFLSANDITRTDLIVAIGGGVVGDLGGFAAATWLRGIDFVQIPTTLLAMVDSSVGGKTGVDLPEGKNLVGAFWQPSLVICDVTLLDTLSAECYADGMAEVIKYGAIMDMPLFEQLAKGPIQGHTARSEMVARCITHKRWVVEQDERDKGIRQILNFGHTLGHAIERESRFAISHGSGVAIGMVAMAQACERQGDTPAGTCARIAACCAAHGLRTENPYDLRTLVPHCMGDKKRDGHSLTLIALARLGEAALLPVAADRLEDFLEGRAYV